MVTLGTCRSGSASSSACSPRSLLALVLGVPTLRLRADYLAIVTIATAEILRLVFGAVEIKDTSSAAPTASTASPATTRTSTPTATASTWASSSFGRNDLWSMTVGWTLVALVLPPRLGAHAQPVGPRAALDP